MAPDLSIKDRVSEHQAFVSRALVIFAIAVLLVVGLIVRLVQLQVWEHDVYRTRSDENRILVQPLAPQRGLIYDRNGVLLADNRPVFSLELVGERIDDLSAFIEELSTVVTISEEDVTGFYERLKRRRRPFEPIVLKLTLTDDEIAKLAVNRLRFINGMQVNAKLVRFYPFGELLTHAIGSVLRVT